MREPGLVASDVDGTLLGRCEAVSARTAAAVGRVIASGTPFVLVTGRPPRWISPVAEAVGAAGYAVCSNGAVLYDIGADRVLAAHTMSPSSLREIAHSLDGVLDGYGLAAERIRQRAVDERLLPLVVEPGYVHPWEGDGPATRPRAEVLGRPAVKLLLTHTGMSSEELAEAVAPILGESVNVTFSAGGGTVELCRSGVTKATGLCTVAEMLGVAGADAVAFGDMPNDLSMLSWAGHGVAMAGAHPDVLAAADEVTVSNEDDGVAQVLERWW